MLEHWFLPTGGGPEQRHVTETSPLGDRSQFGLAQGSVSVELKDVSKA